MAVHCSHCGEELLGAVNRCWKCGKAFAAQPTAEGLPPVRRVPLTAAPETPESTEPLVQAELAGVASSGEQPASATDAVGRPVRSGTPFSAESTPKAVSAAAVPLSPLPADSLRRATPALPNTTAMGGTIGAIVLGLFALVLAPFRAEAALVAMIGMVMGLWGLYSPRRAWALVGLLICCLAIGIASYTGAKALNVLLNRNKAWDPDAVDIENLIE